MTTEDLIEAARRDIADADRCAALHVTPAVYQLHRRLREVADALSALSSPPADDVREADAESLEDFMQDWYDRWAGPGETWAVRDMAASIVEEWLPKVRSRGTVTDAEVEAAARAYAGDEMSAADWEWIRSQPRLVEPYLKAMRAALEAARGARVSAENATPTNHEVGSTYA